MRFNIICLLLFTGITQPTIAQKRKVNTDLEFVNLKGSVKKVTEHYHGTDTFANGKFNNPKLIRSYNNSGSITGYIVTYDSVFTNNYKYLYKYNNDQNMVEKTGYNWKDSLNYIHHFMYKKGRLIKESIKKVSSIVYGESYHPELNGKLEKRTIIYTYNKNNLILKEIASTDSIFSQSYHYKYNNQEDMIEEDIYHIPSETKSNHRILYKYDVSGNIIEKSYYSSDSTFLHKNIYKYDTLGNEIVNEVQNRKGNGLSDFKIIYIYNNNSNIIHEKDYNEDGNLRIQKTYIYEFDKIHNWIKKTEYENGELKETTVREIEYYLDE